jgi:hypothetical protein
VAAFEAEEFLVKRARGPDVLRVLHHEVERPDGNHGAAGGDGFLGGAGHGAMSEEKFSPASNVCRAKKTTGRVAPRDRREMHDRAGRGAWAQCTS